MAKPTQTPEADRVLDRISEMELSLIRPLGAFNTAVVDASMDLVEEWTSFMARRVREDVRTLHQMLHCRNPAKMQQIQSGFVQHAINEYQEEAARMTAILRKVAPAAKPDGELGAQQRSDA